MEESHLGPFSAPDSFAETIVLAGPNGSGKSSFLDLIAHVLSSIRGLSYPSFRQGFDFNGEIELTFTPGELAVLRKETSISVPPAMLSDYFADNDSLVIEYDHGPKSQSYQVAKAAHNALKSYYGRPFGIFFRADRHYPSQPFNPNMIFSYRETRQALYAEQFAFNFSDTQFNDLFNHIAQLGYHYNADLGLYYKRKERGELEVNATPPVNPVSQYSDLLGRVLPGYSIWDSEEGVPTDLHIVLPSGEVIPFSNLSSGEKEVFFILASFLRYGIRDSLVIIDEPELHLHPELARVLVRELKRVAPGSQIWMATHNAEIIDEAGRDRVYYTSRNNVGNSVKIAAASDEEGWSTQLRTLFGEAGYVGVGRTLLFSEGLAASVDRRTFTTLFPDLSHALKIVPSGGVDTHLRLNSAVLSLLESNVGWLRFYLVRDRDFLTAEMAARYREKGKGRIHVLGRCQIENYLLDFEAIAKVMRDIYGREGNARFWRNKLHAIASRISGEVTASLVAYRFNLLAAPQDYSLPRLFVGRSIMSGEGAVNSSLRDTLVAHAVQKAEEVTGNLTRLTSRTDAYPLISQWMDEVVDALNDPGDAWIGLFPGKDLIKHFVKDENLGPVVAFENNMLRMIASMNRVSEELKNLVAKVTAGEFLEAN
ncbi:ATP-binding protein [Actinosynnema sp. NPDC002837]